MHEVPISPVLMHIVDVDLPQLVDTTLGVLADAATAAFIARSPAVTAIRHASVIAVKATMTGVARIPVFGLTVFAPIAFGSSAARIPQTQIDQFLMAVKATASGSARIVSTISGVGVTIVAALPAAASANAKIPVVTGSISVTVTAVIATAGQSAGIVGTGLSGSVNAVVAKTNVSIPSMAEAPVVISEIVLTGGGPGIGTFMANVPVVSGTGASYTGPALASMASLDGTGGSPADIPALTGVQANDMVILAIYIEPTGAIVTPPGGFTEATSSPVVVTGAGSHDLHIYWRRPGAPESGTYSFTYTGGSYRTAVVMRLTGAVTTGQPFATQTSAAEPIASFTTPPVTATTVASNRFWIWVGTSYASFSTCSTVSGFTEVFDVNGFGIAIDTRPGVSPETLTNVTGTWTVSQSHSAWLGAVSPT